MTKRGLYLVLGSVACVTSVLSILNTISVINKERAKNERSQIISSMSCKDAAILLNGYLDIPTPQEESLTDIRAFGSDAEIARLDNMLAYLHTLSRTELNGWRAENAQNSAATTCILNKAKLEAATNFHPIKLPE